jgi:hypothetical protein
MSTLRQIKCITKTNRSSPHERISHVGGDWGKITTDEAIRLIENDTYNYHVKVGFSDAKVIVAKHEGNKYLKTVADTTYVDNLLSLLQCV